MRERLIRVGDEPKLLALLVLQQSLFLAAGIGLWIWSGGSATQFLGPPLTGLLLGLALAAALILLSGAISLLRPAMAERLALEQGRRAFSTERPYGLGAIVVISVSAGIGEEALFRGGIQPLLGNWMHPWAAIIVTSLLFTAAHPGSRMLMTSVATLSLVLSLAFHWSGSLLTVMIAHALFDVFGCICIQRLLQRAGHYGNGAG